MTIIIEVEIMFAMRFLNRSKGLGEEVHRGPVALDLAHTLTSWEGVLHVHYAL